MRCVRSPGRLALLAAVVVLLAACSTIVQCGQETEDGCGARQPDRYVRDGIATIVAEWDAIEGPAATGDSGAPAPTKQRQQLIDHFQKNDGTTPILLLSLKAGGVGLNLTAATHVFHFDRWWNPAVENQATDRAFRIGQHRTVNVHKMISEGTLEERIDQMIEQKTELAQQIIGSGESWLTELSTGQLRDLLTLRRETLEDEE
jgi:hypothetical protein